MVEFINDDMPFLVDSIAMEINRMGFGVQLVVHPLYAAERDANGQLTNPADPARSQRLESWIHVETDRITDPDRMKELASNLERVLSDVRASVVD